MRKLFNNVVGAQAMLLAGRKRFPEAELSLLTEEAFPIREVVALGNGAAGGRYGDCGYL